MVEDIFSVYFNDWKSIFTFFFFVKATSLVHDLKKEKREKKRGERNTLRGD